jgi:hypothetical protein
MSKTKPTKKTAPKAAAPAGPSLPNEAHYGGQNVSLGGRFHLPDEVVAMRLSARGLWSSTSAPSKSKTKAYFAGRGETPEMRAKAEKAGVPIFGEADMRTLIATPLFRFREDVTRVIERELDSPGTSVTTWYVGPPATEAQLAAAEQAFGVPLDPALRAFYTQCDGVQFRCDDTRPADRQELAAQKRSWGEVGGSSPDLGHGTGVLSLLPIDELVRSRCFGKTPADGRGRTVRLGQRTVDLERFIENLYVFDFWNEFYPVGLYVDRDAGELRIVIGDDYGAVWDDPNVETVESYLEALRMTRGEGRQHGARYYERPRA